MPPCLSRSLALGLLCATLASPAPAQADAPAPGPSADAPPPLALGLHALLFSLPAINEAEAEALVGSGQVALGDFVGAMPARPAKAVVLAFVTRDTAEAALPALSQLQRKTRSKGVQVLALLSEPGSLATTSTWLRDAAPPFPVLRDQHRVVSGRYGVSVFPLYVVLDQNGRVFAVGNPAAEQLAEALDNEVTAALQLQTTP